MLVSASAPRLDRHSGFRSRFLDRRARPRHLPAARLRRRPDPALSRALHARRTEPVRSGHRLRPRTALAARRDGRHADCRGPGGAARHRRREPHRRGPAGRSTPRPGTPGWAAGWPRPTASCSPRSSSRSSMPAIARARNASTPAWAVRRSAASRRSILGLRHADVFSKLAVLSPSAWWGRRAILRSVAKARPKPETRIWLDIGSGEGRVAVADARRVREALVAAGWRDHDDLRYVESPGATHSEAAWAQPRRATSSSSCSRPTSEGGTSDPASQLGHRPRIPVPEPGQRCDSRDMTAGRQLRETA